MCVYSLIVPIGVLIAIVRWQVRVRKSLSVSPVEYIEYLIGGGRKSYERLNTDRQRFMNQPVDEVHHALLVFFMLAVIVLLFYITYVLIGK